MALGGVRFSKVPDIEASAMVGADGEAEVTVSNHSRSTFTNVRIAGSGRVRVFPDVPAGGTVTVPFKVNSDIRPFGGVFPIDTARQEQPPSTNVGLTYPQSRGAFMLTGQLNGDFATAGLSGSGRGFVSVMGAIAPGDHGDGLGALRIDEVGGLSAAQKLAVANNPGGMGVGVEGPEGITTTTMPPVPGSTAIDGPDGNGGAGTRVIPAPSYVRLTPPRDVTSQPCGVSTMVGGLLAWNGTRWTPLTKVGGPHLDPRLVGLEDKPLEVQEWQLPAMAGGRDLYLRVDAGGELMSDPVLLFSCGRATT